MGNFIFEYVLGIRELLTLLSEIVTSFFYLVGEEAAILSGPLFRHAALSGDLNAKYSYGQLLRLGMLFELLRYVH